MTNPNTAAVPGAAEAVSPPLANQFAGQFKSHFASQGALLFGGYATAQALSFARNALIGHALSKGDFGIAATITLVLQLIETLSDLGSDRLIVQADDGDQPRFVATAHTVLVARGVVLSLLMLGLAPLLAQFFNIPSATFAFQAAALTPLIKGFVHLDCRRAQRHFDNRPQLLVEVVPQLVALVLTVPMLSLAPSYSAVVWLAVVQALTAVVISHGLAGRSYRFAADRPILRRQIAFGWPILASALPLIAVYQGDRIIIGRLAGMDMLAAYSVAFMVTMVPGLIAAKVGHALMLPMFAQAVRRGDRLQRRFSAMTEATVVFAALYLAGFIVAGAALVPLVFGAHYTGLGPVTSWLAVMWALRMIQAVPGMAMMAYGKTKPFFIAGLIRAHALPCVLWAASAGHSLAVLAAIGCVFEALSLFYVAIRLEAEERGLGSALLMRTGFLAPVALSAVLAANCSGGTVLCVTALTGALCLGVAGAGAALMPSLRAHLRRALDLPPQALKL